MQSHHLESFIGEHRRPRTAAQGVATVDEIHASEHAHVAVLARKRFGRPFRMMDDEHGVLNMGPLPRKPHRSVDLAGVPEHPHDRVVQLFAGFHRFVVDPVGAHHGGVLGVQVIHLDLGRYHGQADGSRYAMIVGENVFFGNDRRGAKGDAGAAAGVFHFDLQSADWPAKPLVAASFAEAEECLEVVGGLHGLQLDLSCLGFSHVNIVELGAGQNPDLRQSRGGQQKQDGHNAGQH